LKIVAECVECALRFFPAQQPVINEDTGQLIADGSMYQGGSYRRIDTA
jgi:hypothetical protein